VTDALGIHRESLVIPLGRRAGRVRRLPNGKFEIIVEAARPSTSGSRAPALIAA